ncbi:hypothetical protein SteCoe_25281 [Stentor coeruleus]|uniref:DUF3447 domain-containing protein n=1 Tax=Stentor coeruleus TaxID=5963 RepID=A0A1R2BFJ8_9CILI|nr:hypothetical protein SteCoe_25281 [Stentor coeruleus]
MGCCESQNLSKSDGHFVKDLKEAIKLGDIRKIIYLIHKKQKLTSTNIDINEFTFKSSGLTLSIPGYCIIYGKHVLFRELYEKFFVSIQKLEESFANYGISVLAILCSKGYSDLLKYYLPLSLSIDPTIYLNTNSFATLNLSIPNEKCEKSTYTPIQLACFYGNINCVKVTLEYFNNSDTPWWMDINFPDTTTNENCALMACRGGHYLMIKYLYTLCNADFKTLNNKNENALQIFLCSCRSNEIIDALKTVSYLIEEIKVDLSHMIEETFLLCDRQDIADYLELKCKEFGIQAVKKDIEEKNKIHIVKKLEETSIASISMDVSHPSSISSFRGSDASNFESVLRHFN